MPEMSEDFCRATLKTKFLSKRCKSCRKARGGRKEQPVSAPVILNSVAMAVWSLGYKQETESLLLLKGKNFDLRHPKEKRSLRRFQLAHQGRGRDLRQAWITSLKVISEVRLTE